MIFEKQTCNLLSHVNKFSRNVTAYRLMENSTKEIKILIFYVNAYKDVKHEKWIYHYVFYNDE